MSSVEVGVKLTPKQAGKLYMRNLQLEEQVKKMRDVLGAIDGALNMGISAADVLDENSTIRDAMREVLSA